MCVTSCETVFPGELVRCSSRGDSRKLPRHADSLKSSGMRVICYVPRDHIPRRTYALFEARSLLREVFGEALSGQRS